MVVVMWYTGCVCCNGCVAQNWLWLCGIVSLVVVFAVMVMWYTGWLIPLFIVSELVVVMWYSFFGGCVCCNGYVVYWLVDSLVYSPPKLQYVESYC